MWDRIVVKEGVGKMCVGTGVDQGVLSFVALLLILGTFVDFIQILL